VRAGLALQSTLIGTGCLYKLTSVVEESQAKSSPGMLVLSPNGQLVAAVRKGGKNIHIIDTEARKLMVKLYRGMQKKEIRSLAISGDNNYLVLVTDENIIHVFYIGPAIRSKYYNYIGRSF
jgi:uncharacterized protein with WD repeat